MLKKISYIFPSLLVFYEIINYLSNDMYLPALPAIMREFDLNTTNVQLTLTTWFAGLACMPLIAGALADRYGRKRTMLVTGCFYILASFVCGLLDNYSVFLIARFVQGAMVSAMFVTGYAVIHELYDHKTAIKLLALMGSVSVLAPALGPLLGAILLLFTGWRGIFLLIGLVGTVVLFFLQHYMPETLPAEERKPLPIRSMLKSYAAILTNRNFLLLSLTLSGEFSGFLVWIAASPLLIIEYFHLSALDFGWIQALIFAANIIGNYSVKYLTDKISLQKLLATGVLIPTFAGVIMVISVLLSPQSLIAFLIPMILYSFGAGLCYAPFNRIIIETSLEPMGMRVAIFTLFLTMAAAAGTVCAGLYFDGSTYSMARLIAGLALLGGIAYFFSDPLNSAE